MVHDVSTDGNGRNFATEWIKPYLPWVVGIMFLAVSQWALNQDRLARTETAIKDAEQRLNERFTALSVRLTQGEANWQAARDTNLQQTNDLLAFQARLAADQQTRDVRTKSRDDQLDGVLARLSKLEDNARLSDRWQATIDERMANMLAQLGRITALLEDRLPDAQEHVPARPERSR